MLRSEVPTTSVCSIGVEQSNLRTVRRVQLGRKPLQARSAERQRPAGQFNTGSILPNDVALQRYIAAGLPIQRCIKERNRCGICGFDVQTACSLNGEPTRDNCCCIRRERNNVVISHQIQRQVVPICVNASKVCVF